MFHPSYLDEIANAIRGPAMQATIDMRIEQIVRHGHDSEHDAMLPIDRLARDAAGRFAAAVDHMSGAGERRDLAAARRVLVRAAAIGLAAIDRIDMAIAVEAKKQGTML